MTIQTETEEVVRAPVVRDSVQAAAHKMEINLLLSGLHSDGARRNRFKH